MHQELKITMLLTRNKDTRICNSYTMACPPVRGDKPRALASGFSNVQEDKHGITIIDHLSVALAHQEIFRAKFNKGGRINTCNKYRIT